jgi:hypothetical protein
MKIKSIIALTVFSLFFGITNNLKSQDSKLSFFDYLFKTPWIVDAGMSHVSNDNNPNPFDFSLKMRPYQNAQRANWYPARFAVEKSLFAFSSKNYLKGFGLQGVLSIQGIQPINFGAADLNLKYHFKALMGEAKITKWFDPYLLAGVGVSDFLYDTLATVHASNGGKLVYNHKYLYPVAQKFTADRFITLNAGVGCNFWITEVVAINLQAEAKFGQFIEKLGGSNYTQYSAGLVFKIGKCNKADTKVEEVKPPASNYKRSKEEEDALIHLREHLNK